MGPFISFVIFGLIVAISACGRDDSRLESRTFPARKNVKPDNDQKGKDVKNSKDLYKTIATWNIQIKAGTKSFQVSKKEHEDFPVTVDVPANVKFEVDDSNFSSPTPEGIASYGSLDISELKDNDMRRCGTSGNDLCAEAVIRIYTKGTPGAGLWNAVDNYGLPILSNTSIVGLGATDAVIAASYTITANTHILKLSDLTSASTFPIPVAVDFSDAAAGTYSSTVVVEYALR